jgi:hypothetical protein
MLREDLSHQEISGENPFSMHRAAEIPLSVPHAN